MRRPFPFQDIRAMALTEIGFGLGLRPEHYEEIAANP
jgi:hypothetical protein